MFARVEVNGPGAHPLYQHLKASTGEELPWNFTRFLVGRDGTVLARFEPQVTPAPIGERLEAYL